MGESNDCNRQSAFVCARNERAMLHTPPSRMQCNLQFNTAVPHAVRLRLCCGCHSQTQRLRLTSSTIIVAGSSTLHVFLLKCCYLFYSNTLLSAVTPLLHGSPPPQTHRCITVRM
jgi:hypothetical protein